MDIAFAVVLATCASLTQEPAAPAAKVISERNSGAQATPAFQFENVPAPRRADAASNARFALVDGRRDRSGAELDALHDGKLPSEADEPASSFFFSRRGDGGRFTIDLGEAREVKQVSTYSWHPGTRGPQVYKLYAADGAAEGFDAAPKRGVDLKAAGWSLLASVDTREQSGQPGGQYGVAITGSSGALGRARHLLFDVQATETGDAFGNTFYSEVDVVTDADPAEPPAPAAVAPWVEKTADGKAEITVDLSQAPELEAWVREHLLPAVRAWYPKITALLPSEGYEAPQRFSIVFKSPGDGVAATGGTRITCAVRWFARNLEGEAVGAVVHELVHVVQQYGRARRLNRDAKPAPGWVTEGIADYVRWFLYEPQSHGADRVRDPERARHDASYRISANFIDWVVRHHDKDVLRKLNAASREGRYSEELWQEMTGKPLAELAAAWRTALGAKAAEPSPGAAAPSQAEPNTLTEAERAAGFRLLFDGTSLKGWHSFRRRDVRQGWQVIDGALSCADPRDAGDLCTDEKFGAFELRLDYKIAPGGNSGVMYHVGDDAAATWASGPECQLLDNAAGRDPEKAGWLYGLYRAEVDATRPAGEWNRLRLLITPEKCEHELNGVKYFEYVLGSEEFAQRVAASKFAKMAGFARAGVGYLALQGDHGVVSFRNVKMRPIGR